MTKIEAVFFDVDGTLLNSDNKIALSTKKVLKKLDELDIHYAIASARGPGAIYPLFRDFDFSCPMIAYNGALIYDKDAKELYSIIIPILDAKEVIDLINELYPEMLTNIYAYEDWIVKDANHPRVKFEEDIVGEYARSGSIDDVKHDGVHKIFCIGKKEEILDLENILSDRFPKLYIARSSDDDVQVNMTGVNKGNGAKILAEHWNISLENTVAFGDSYNDKEMLSMVGKGFVMGNADQELKNIIGQITDSNDEDGIYNALAKLDLFTRRNR